MLVLINGKKEAVHAHTVKPFITLQLNAYFDFRSQLSGRCASLLKVYEELSRALATVGRAKLFLLLQLSADCFERRNKKRQEESTRSQFDSSACLMEWWQTHLLIPQLYLHSHLSFSPPSDACLYNWILSNMQLKNNALKEHTWNEIQRERERECQEMEFFKGRKTVNTEDNMNMNRLWGLIFTTSLNLNFQLVWPSKIAWENNSCKMQINLVKASRRTILHLWLLLRGKTRYDVRLSI